MKKVPCRSSTPILDRNADNQPASDQSCSGSSPSKNGTVATGVQLRARKRVWTAAEDEEMDRGFRLHGYKWELIAKDPDLHFDNRTGSQIRDRFRLRYPDLYAQQGVILTDGGTPSVKDEKAKNAASRKGKRQSQRKDLQDKNAASVTQSDAGPPKAGKCRNLGNEAKGNESSFAIDRVLNSEREIRPENGGSDDSSGRTNKTSKQASSNAGVDWLQSRLVHPGDSSAAETTKLPTLALPSIGPEEWVDADVPGASSLTLPPLNWEDLVPPSTMFDIT